MTWPARPRTLNRNLTCLLAGRVLRSVSQAYLVIIVPLFLVALGYNAVDMGIMFAISAIASAILAALTGFLSDRFGRKSLLILLSLMTAIGGGVFALSTGFVTLTVAAAFGSIGRGGGAGSSGAFGPYYPAEQALVAEQALDANRTSVFGLLSFVGVIGGALGSLAAQIPRLLRDYRGLPMLESYRALFATTVAIGIAMALVTVPIREAHRFDDLVSAARRTGSKNLRTRRAEAPGGLFGLSRPTWRLVSRFMITNLTNGLAIGMLGPFMVYWLYRRYDADAADIGRLFFVINLVAAIPYLMAGRIAARLGSVRAVVICRAISTVLLALMVTAPTFAIAGVLYAVRMVFNTISIPVRQSFLMGVIKPAERSSAAGLSSFPSQVGSSISPFLAGYFMQHLSLELPIEFAAALQGINAILYYVFFRDVRPPEEASEISAIRSM